MTKTRMKLHAKLSAECDKAEPDVARIEHLLERLRKTWPKCRDCGCDLDEEDGPKRCDDCLGYVPEPGDDDYIDWDSIDITGQD
jgi:hypothetical protein